VDSYPRVCREREKKASFNNHIFVLNHSNREKQANPVPVLLGFRFGLAFVIEVMRMLIEFLKFSKIDVPDPTPKKPNGGGFRRKGSVDSNCSDASQGSYISSEIHLVKSLESIHEEGQSLHSNRSASRTLKKLWKLHWKKSIIFLPLVTALPSLFMVFSLQSSMGWRYVHGKSRHPIPKHQCFFFLFFSRLKTYSFLNEMTQL
jgi:hypothetical protein